MPSSRRAREAAVIETERNRQHFCKGLIFGADGRAFSPANTQRRGRRYYYYVAQSVVKGTDDTGSSEIVRRVSAAEIDTAVISQVRMLLRQPEIVVGTWLAGRAEMPDLTENDVHEALQQLDPLWEQLFPAEQARIVHLLVERVEVGPTGATIRLRVSGLASLAGDLGALAAVARRVAA